VNKNPALEFMIRFDEAGGKLRQPASIATDDQIKDFLYRVLQVLQRYPELAEWMDSISTPKQQHQQANKFIKHLTSAIGILQGMGGGTDTVIHQHFVMDQGVSLPITKIGGRTIETNLQALIQATRSYQQHDINPSSKLKPAEKRRHMPLLFHVGQAWEKVFWIGQEKNKRKSPPINANENSAFFQFTAFLISDVIGDKHHRNESLIRIAKKEGLLP
jgi:hypothetical protein